MKRMNDNRIRKFTYPVVDIDQEDDQEQCGIKALNKLW